MSNGAGKGDKRRPFNVKKWERGYVIAFGKECPVCCGTGISIQPKLDDDSTCKECSGLGKVERCVT